MDELFFLPRTPIAMPRAYWLEDTLSSQIAVIEPSKYQFERVLQAFRQRRESAFDMEILNDLYAQDCIIIPHRQYDLLTGEFRKTEHQRYLGSTTEQWDAEKVLKEAKYVHFSDWPYPKPWKSESEVERLRLQPKCYKSQPGKQDCTDRMIWNEIYREFRERRRVRT
jgi:hypothetical protein